MDLDKAKALVLSSKRAIFYPGVGSPLSGRYTWKEENYIVHLDYDGRKDRILDFQSTPVLDLEHPRFEGLMQKHMISYKKLPDNLMDRVRRLTDDQEENLFLIQERAYVFPAEEQRFLFFRPILGYGSLDEAHDWRLGLEESECLQTITQKLWEQPGVHAVNPPQKVSFYLNDYLKNVEKYLNAMHHAEFGLIKEEEVIFSVGGRYLWIHLDAKGRVSDRVILKPDAYQIPEKTVLEYIWESHYKRHGNHHPYFHLKKLPASILQILPELFEDFWTKQRA